MTGAIPTLRRACGSEGTGPQNGLLILLEFILIEERMGRTAPRLSTTVELVTALWYSSLHRLHRISSSRDKFAEAEMIFYLLGTFSVITPRLSGRLFFVQKLIPVKNDRHTSNTIV